MEVPTLQQKREREEATKKAEGKTGEQVTYRRERGSQGDEL